MTLINSFLVNRDDFTSTRLNDHAAASELAPGQVLVKIDRFAFTANNITYAATGVALKYWEFFPAPEGEGIIPVWGFADVVDSQCEEIDVGERLYGYFPMASHLVLEPVHIKDDGFIDGADHRQALSVTYNQYRRCVQDPLYHPDTEALQMLLRPLFTTSFLLDDFFDDNEFFGANTIILTSASSKTALGLAYLLQRNRESRDNNYEIVGLTSPGNQSFVEGLGYYDSVVPYEELESLDSSKSAVTVDLAGNAVVLQRLHGHFNTQLKYSCLVGASHWDQASNESVDLAGPAPQFFFAPSQAEKRIGDWGGEAFGGKLALVWNEFTAAANGWMTIQADTGPEALKRVYDEVLAGHMSPNTGYILGFQA